MGLYALFEPRDECHFAPPGSRRRIECERSHSPLAICLAVQVKVAQTKVAKTKVVQTKVAQTKVAQTKVAQTKVALEMSLVQILIGPRANMPAVSVATAFGMASSLELARAKYPRAVQAYALPDKKTILLRPVLIPPLSSLRPSATHRQ
jgi:hypothetical protein